VVVDVDFLPFLDGSRIDFAREGLNESFRFENPNVDNTCGCGESFSVKEEPARV
jgi:iron-sulfur cluster assembly protein